jgi:4-hydroxy-3-methylbut-2-enyl diphosphate reductase IspH
LELTYEKIGNELARQCHRNISDLWLHEKLIHNKRDVERMAATIRDVIFVDDNA